MTTKSIPLADGTAWYVLPYQPAVELSTVWANKIQGTNGSTGSFTFDIGSDETGTWCVFETATMPSDGWAGAYATVKFFQVADDYSTSAQAKINQHRSR